MRKSVSNYSNENVFQFALKDFKIYEFRKEKVSCADSCKIIAKTVVTAKSESQLTAMS